MKMDIKIMRREGGEASQCRNRMETIKKGEKGNEKDFCYFGGNDDPLFHGGKGARGNC